MTVSVVTRYIVPNVAASTDIAKRSKALWIKNGALDVRLNQIFTGPYTGQWLLVVMHADMAAYAKASAAMAGSADMKQLLAEHVKSGGVMQEREILVGTDI
jgi:hypothetical protein